MPKMGPRYRVPFRRAREGKTDYRKRLKLIRSGKPRLVVRVSSRHVRAQVTSSSATGDSTLASANSKQLSKYGWKGATSNLPSAYLVGLLCGKRALKANVTESILDMGIHEPVKGNKVFAALKGALDAGLKVPHDKEILPADERIAGAHISGYAAGLKEKVPEAYSSRFSQQLRQSLSPESLQEHFKEVKQKILSEFGG